MRSPISSPCAPRRPADTGKSGEGNWSRSHWWGSAGSPKRPAGAGRCCGPRTVVEGTGAQRSRVTGFHLSDLGVSGKVVYVGMLLKRLASHSAAFPSARGERVRRHRTQPMEFLAVQTSRPGNQSARRPVSSGCSGLRPWALTRSAESPVVLLLEAHGGAFIVSLGRDDRPALVGGRSDRAELASVDACREGSEGAGREVQNRASGVLGVTDGNDAVRDGKVGSDLNALAAVAAVGGREPTRCLGRHGRPSLHAPEHFGLTRPRVLCEPLGNELRSPMSRKVRRVRSARIRATSACRLRQPSG